MRRKYFRFGFFILLFCLTGMIRARASADSGHDGNNRAEIVFLLDTSISMNTQDKDREAIEAIRQAVYSLPSGYQAGMVAYNTGIQTTIPLSPDPEMMDRQLSSITYAGYTNAGEGLQQAVGLFSDGEGMERSIFLMTDGEIDMPDQRQKENSRSLYTKAASEAARRGIRIYIIAIGSELGNPQMHIFDGAETTDGAVYWEGQSGTLAGILERILVERMKVPWKEARATAEADGKTLEAEIPSGASYVRFLMTSNEELDPFSAECRAESQKITSGRNFAVVELKRPSSGQVRICFEENEKARDNSVQGKKETAEENGKGVSICILIEYATCVKMDVQYQSRELTRTEEEVKKNIPPKYEHLADIAVKAVDESDGRTNLWDREELEGREISYILNGDACKGVIQGGQIKTVIPADGIEEVRLSVDMEGLGDVWQVRQAEPVRIGKTPDPVFLPEPDYRPLWGILGFLAAVLVFLGLWEKKKHTTILYMDSAGTGDKTEKPLVLKDTPYSGKFNLYVVRTRDGKDIPPHVYRLFGRSPGRITLKQILDTCRIYYGERESGDILFCPGPEHSVILEDRSDRCTVMRGAEILKKGRGYPVYYNEKITITFYEEDTEIELHYKNLKPSEREIMG